MTPRLDCLAATQGGVVLRRQAVAHGYSVTEVERLCRAGVWVRIRRGAYVERTLWTTMTAEARHKAIVHAVILSLVEPAVASHVSAGVMNGLPTWGYDLSTAHVTRGDLHSPRTEAGVQHHAASLWPDDVIEIGGVAATSPVRTAIDMARLGGFERGVVAADAAFRLSPDDPEALLRCLDRMRDWPGARDAGRVVEFADPRSESVGESRNRVAFELAGLPRPVPQDHIVDPSTGLIVARVDFHFLEHATIGEFDGRQKYRGEALDDMSAAEVVWREKRREDMLRDLGYEVCRVIWPELDMIALIRNRFLKAFERASKRRAVLI
jgi:hypothetical protein